MKPPLSLQTVQARNGSKWAIAQNAKGGTNGTHHLYRRGVIHFQRCFADPVMGLLHGLIRDRRSRVPCLRSLQHGIESSEV